MSDDATETPRYLGDELAAMYEYYLCDDGLMMATLTLAKN